MASMFACIHLSIALSSHLALGARTPLEQDEIVGPVGGLRDGDSKYETQTRRLARTEIAQCVDPELEPDLFDAETPWLPPLQRAAEELGTGHAQTAWKPLEGFVEPHVGTNLGNRLSEEVIPYHRAAVPNSDQDTFVPAEMDYPTSRCFQLNYSSIGPDPYGCKPFKKSFSRLQQLRQCIVGHLQHSRRWLMYREVGKMILQFQRTFSDWRERQDFDLGLFTTIDATLEEGLDEAEKMYIRAIKANMSQGLAWKDQVIFDANHRSDEMIKYVAFKDWAPMTQGLLHLVNRKLRETISQVVLEEQVITKIRTECFKVDVDSYALLPLETKILRRALPCVPLMWDSVEVGGAPHKPVSNAVTMWDERVRVSPTIKLDLPNTPPVCGRIALALMKRPLIYAKSYNPTTCLVGQTSWPSCLSLKHYNCICLEKCWVAALRLACKLAKGCCSDDEAMRGYDKFSNVSRAVISNLSSKLSNYWGSNDTERSST